MGRPHGPAHGGKYPPKKTTTKTTVVVDEPSQEETERWLDYIDKVRRTGPHWKHHIERQYKKYPNNLRNIYNELKVVVTAERAKGAEKKKAQALALERRRITRRIPSSQDTSSSSDPSSSTASCQTFRTTSVTQAMLERERGRPRKEQSKPSQLSRGTTSLHNAGPSSREQSASQDATRFSLSEDSSSIHNAIHDDHNMLWDDTTVKNTHNETFFKEPTPAGPSSLPSTSVLVQSISSSSDVDSSPPPMVRTYAKPINFQKQTSSSDNLHQTDTRAANALLKSPSIVKAGSSSNAEVPRYTAAEKGKGRRTFRPLITKKPATTASKVLSRMETDVENKARPSSPRHRQLTSSSPSTSTAPIHPLEPSTAMPENVFEMQVVTPSGETRPLTPPAPTTSPRTAAIINNPNSLQEFLQECASQMQAIDHLQEALHAPVTTTARTPEAPMLSFDGSLQTRIESCSPEPVLHGRRCPTPLPPNNDFLLREASFSNDTIQLELQSVGKSAYLEQQDSQMEANDSEPLHTTVSTSVHPEALQHHACPQHAELQASSSVQAVSPAVVVLDNEVEYTQAALSNSAAKLDEDMNAKHEACLPAQWEVQQQASTRDMESQEPAKMHAPVQDITIDVQDWNPTVDNIRINVSFTRVLRENAFITISDFAEASMNKEDIRLLCASIAEEQKISKVETIVAIFRLNAALNRFLENRQ